MQDQDIILELLRRARTTLPQAGDRFGQWIFTGQFGYMLSGIPRLTCGCRCDCGTKGFPLWQSLRNGASLSCGCDKARLGSITRRARQPYRRTEDPIYWVWRNMLRRCYAPRDHNYPWYGGRGIYICDAWREAFENFRDWARANGYAKGLTIDRINNDGPYAPGNCRWTDMLTQARNKRNNRRLTAFGETKTVAEWAEDPRCKAKVGTVYARLEHGSANDAALAVREPKQLTAFGETKSLKAWATDPRCQVSYKVLWQRLHHGVAPEAALTGGRWEVAYLPAPAPAH